MPWPSDLNHPQDLCQLSLLKQWPQRWTAWVSVAQATRFTSPMPPQREHRNHMDSRLGGAGTNMAHSIPQPAKRLRDRRLFPPARGEKKRCAATTSLLHSSGPSEGLCSCPASSPAKVAGPIALFPSAHPLERGLVSSEMALKGPTQSNTHRHASTHAA